MAYLQISNTLMLPPYDEYTKTYIFADGMAMPELEYWAWRHNLEQKQKEHNDKAQMEYELKCIEATEFVNDMLKGYAPSIAIQRSNKRRYNGNPQ